MTEISYQLITTVKDAANIIQNCRSCMFGYKLKKPLDESNSKFLLFTWCVNVCKKNRNVMPADQGHISLIIIPFIPHIGSLLVPICSSKSMLTFIYSIIRYFGLVNSLWTVSCQLNVMPNLVNKSFWDKVFGVVKRDARPS